MKCCAPPFTQLPDELIRFINMFGDIQSMIALSQCDKYLLSLSDEDAWSYLVQRRFLIRTNVSKPKLHGGRTWKEAYRSLAICQRIPKTRLTCSRKIVFAKGGDGMITQFTPPHNPGSANNSSGMPHTKVQVSSVGLWVLMAHTDSCETRTYRNSLSSDRYVELHLALQNVRSGFSTVDVDVGNASLQFLIGGGQRTGAGYYSSQIVTNGPCKPKILSHNRRATPPLSSSSSSSFFSNTSSRNKSNGGGSEGCGLPPNDVLTLQPFEFVVVSVHFPCAQDMIFETDFLSRALSICIPVRNSRHDGSSTTETLDDLCFNYHSPNIMQSLGFGTKESDDSRASALFLPEKDVWNYYQELPGNCLTLCNRGGSNGNWEIPV